MADKAISSLDAITELSDDAILVAEQQGEAGKVSGKQIKDFAKAGVSAYVEAAVTAANNALEAAQQAQEAVANVQDASAQAAAAQAANEAAQAAMQSALAAQAAAEAAAQSAADDAVVDVDANMQSYVTAAQKAQAAAEAARDQAQAIAGGDFLPLAGGTLTGALTLAGAPTEDLHAATKKYVDDIPDETYGAEYGVTSFDDVKSAADSGKFVYCKKGTLTFYLSVNYPSILVFQSVSNTEIATIQLSSSGGWSTVNSGFLIPYKAILKSGMVPVYDEELEGYQVVLAPWRPTVVSVTLAVSGWDSSSKTQTVNVSGVLADETAQFIQPTPSIASQTAYYDAGIKCTAQAADSLTFTADTVPDADLTIYIVIQEVTA